jgi:hypothetical protein
MGQKSQFYENKGMSERRNLCDYATYLQLPCNVIFHKMIDIRLINFSGDFTYKNLLCRKAQ